MKLNDWIIKYIPFEYQDSAEKELPKLVKKIRTEAYRKGYKAGHSDAKLIKIIKDEKKN